MQSYNLNTMIKGWFVGDFKPVALSNKDFEVAIKRYRRGEVEAAHYHKLAVELTVVVEGKVRMCGCIFGSGEIIRLDKGEATEFEALEDTVTVVVKTPSVANDKYPA